MSEYSFFGIEPTSVEDDETMVPTEGFRFADVDTAAEGLYLIERSAPSPKEKEITVDLPYTNGVLDFSMIGDNRFFDRRTIEYNLQLFDTVYHDRKLVEQEYKRRLMLPGVLSLYDTHDKGYHWIGKCSSVSVDDTEDEQTLEVKVKFDCYPFAIMDKVEGNDRWNDVFFPHWVFQKTRYTVNGELSIGLYNIGGAAVLPDIVVTGSIAIEGPFGIVNVTEGSYSDTQVALTVGANSLTLTGTGTVEFIFHREEMI